MRAGRSAYWGSIWPQRRQRANWVLSRINKLRRKGRKVRIRLASIHAFAVAVQVQTAEPNMHDITIQRWRRAILRNQRDLFAGLLSALLESLNRQTPCGALAVPRLPRASCFKPIKHVPLHPPTAGYSTVPHDASIALEQSRNDVPKPFYFIRSCVSYNYPRASKTQRLP